jgi:hypothetical protein
MRAYISSADSRHLYPQNTPSNFHVQLPHYMEGVQSCGVAFCLLPNRPTGPTYVMGDFVESSILGMRLQPVLCMTLAKTKDFLHIDHIPIKTDQLFTLHIKLVNRQGAEVVMSRGETLLVLDFQK